MIIQKTEHLLGQIKMGWKQTILFSLAVGIFCGIFGGLPILTDTSFTDMAGGYEWWIVFAVIITVNCDRFWDAGLKCGVFFLITQPLQFYIQALLYSHNFGNAFYYFKLWLPVIIATVPGGMIAYFSKKENIWGSVILGIGNAMEWISCVHYVLAFLASPPRHLIAALVSFLSVIWMTLCLQKKTVYRVISFAVAVVLTGVVIAYIRINQLEL